MSKPARKLSLRKETVRQLDATELARVGGGTNIDLLAYRQPSRTGPTQTTTASGLFNFNYYYYY